jgi:hypothetical protein
VHLFEAGARWWPDKECEEKHIKPEQDLRFEEDSWHGKIADFVSGKARVTVLQVAHEGLLIDTPRVGTSDARRISHVLARLGWRRGKDDKGRYFQKEATV